MFTQPMTTSIVSTGSESVTFTPPRTSEMSADLNHVVASNFGVSSGDFTKSNSPVLNPFANNRSEQINKPFDPNNYFEQREKELNHREAYLILRENALTKGPLAAGERSPEGGTDYPSENVWPSVEPNPFKKYVANDVGYQHHTSHVNRRSYEHGPSSFANKTPRTEVPPPPGFQTFGGSRGFELHRENYTPVGYDLPPPGFGDLGQEYLSLPTGPCGIFDRHDARPRPLPFEGRNMYDGLRYSGEAGDTGLRGHSGSVNEVQGLIDAMRTMTTHINRSHVAPLPKEERFSGDPLTYRRFVKHFDSYLTKGVVDMAEKLDLLISSCAGEARANIADCIMARTPDLGYFEARRILERLYGQDHTIVSAYINKIVNGPPIKANDRQALAALGRDMRNCLMACGSLNSAGLDTQQTVSSVFTRLPRHLQDKFVASVTMHLETGRPVTFAMLADFVERRSLVEASFLGQVVEQRGDRGRDKGAKFNQPFRKASINTVRGEASRPSRSNGAGNTQCEFCSLGHALWKCQEFGKESVEKRWSFAKDKRLCFNCLGHHFSKSCKSKVRCSNCKASHHTLLHRAPRETVSPPDGASKEVGNGAGEVRQVMSVSMKPVKPSEESHGLEEEARAARENSTTQTRTCQVRLRVVPVRVWGDGKRLVDTYAFLDEGSDTTLCTDGLIDKLKVRGESVRISLATVNGTETQVARRVSLSAQGFDEVATIHLPNVISVPSLPGLRSSIPTGRDLDLYPEMLKGVTFPDLECGVELLIGADVPGAHRSLEYRMNHSGGPNAVRCALGWGLVGPTALPREFVANEVGHVNFVQSERVVLNDLMKRMYETDFLSKGKDIDLGASVEDKRALRAMEESVTKVSGHYQISLPWRSARAKLPNNKIVAENRVEYLGKRLEKDPEMHQKYRDKMKEYLENGHARKVPKDSLAPSLKTWYVPHHATRGKFRIVFDCAAKFRGTSLNDHLLQGPDHTSSLVGAELTEFVQNELDFDPDEVVYWTDSTSVLGYIRSTARRYRTFVANRIAVVQSLSSPEQWRHVSTDQNPADVASRGQMPDQLPQSDIWFNGPAFLWLEQDKWPIASENSNSDSTISDAELLKCHQVLHAVCKTTSAETDPLGPLLTYFSTFTKLKRAVAWFVRLTKIIRAKSSKALGNLMLGPVLFASELASAELDIVKHVQLCSFPEELASLKNENISANNDKSLTGRNLKTSRLRKLSPVLVNGVLCVGGRLQRSSLPVASKHPIVLPSAHHVTSLIVLHAHAAEGHSGPLHTLAKIREKYWVVRGHATVRKVLNTCTICRVRRASPGQQFMAPLPTPRVTPGRAPFASCGVDYAGPLLTRVGRSNTKRYICLFTCLATRAVHLEMACALDIDSFLEAFTRFSNRRGTPEELWSDNATNFVGANKELRDSIRDWNQTNIQSSLARRGVTWKFNPPAASHQGGVWERMVRSVKRVLNVIAGGSVMTDESLSTLLTEVERIVNSRPITAVSSDPRDLEALTPHHLLTGRTDATLPLGKFIHADGYRKSWRLVGLKADQFWSRWVKEYLPLLQHREKWLVPKRNLRVGDLVLIAGESMTRGQWPKGLIEETFAGKDGLVRSARVRTATSPALIRDVRKLHLLEASH